MLVNVQGLSARYTLPGKEPVWALSDVYLQINEGQIVGLLGKNGSGKTTLFRVLLGLLHADRGEALVHGLDPKKSRRDILKLTGVILDGQRDLPPRWTPTEVIEYVGSCYNLSSKEIRNRSEHLLEKFNLIGSKNKMVSTLSRGMKQKLSLIIALINDPKLVVLDEPTLGLDVESTRELLAHIHSLKNTGCGVVISSHQLKIIEKISDMVSVIDKGRTVFFGSPVALIDKVGRGRVRLRWRSQILPSTLSGLPSGVLPTEDQTLLVDNDTSTLSRVFLWADRHRLELESIEQAIGFEEAYLKLVKDG